MKSDLRALVLLGLMTSLFVLGVGCQVRIWQECREMNSFIYCWKLINR